MKKLLFGRQSVFALIVAAAPNIASAEPEIAIPKGKSIFEELLGDRNREITGDVGRLREIIEGFADRKIVRLLQEGNDVEARRTANRYGLALTLLPSTGSGVVLSFVPLGRLNLSAADAVTAAKTYVTITTGGN